MHALEVTVVVFDHMLRRREVVIAFPLAAARALAAVASCANVAALDKGGIGVIGDGGGHWSKAYRKPAAVADPCKFLRKAARAVAGRRAGPLAAAKTNGTAGASAHRRRRRDGQGPLRGRSGRRAGPGQAAGLRAQHRQAGRGRPPPAQHAQGRP